MISVSNLSKKYGQFQALNGISFNIKQGECYGLLGPNGAGKTTIVSILSTILHPDEGTVTIGEFDLKKQPIECKKIIGVVPQEIALYDEMSAFDNLIFWGKLYNVPIKELKDNVDKILNLFGLYDRQNDKIKTYSGGMKRRINIAASLLHNPKVLFMDEPTVGIDPQSRNLIFEVVEKLHKDGLTIIYTTHYMEEAERLCDRIGIIDHGQIIAQGTLEELKKSSEIKESVSIHFTDIPEHLAIKIKSDFPSAKQIDSAIYFYTDNLKNDLSKIILKCNELGLEIKNIDIQKVNLETIFLNLTGKQLRD